MGEKSIAENTRRRSFISSDYSQKMQNYVSCIDTYNSVSSAKIDTSSGSDDDFWELVEQQIEKRRYFIRN